MWLKLPEDTRNYAMVVYKTRMNSETNQMEYQLTYEEQLYNQGAWFKQDSVKKR